MTPLRETVKPPSRTAQVPLFLQSNDKFHTLSPERQQTLSVIYQGLFQRSGKDAAQTWLESQLESAKAATTPYSPLGNRLETLKTYLKAPRDPTRNTPRSPTPGLETKTGTPAPPKAPEAVLTPLESLDQKIAFLEAQLSPTGFRCYRLLLEVAHKVARARGYAPGVGVVTFFCPQEIVAHVLGVDRTTIWRNLPKLIALGLLDAAEWKGDLYGDTRNAGYLWQVKLDPTSPHKPRLRHDEFKHPWRDLTADVEAHKTAFKTVKKPRRFEGCEPMQQSLAKKSSKQAVDQILSWALPPALHQDSLTMTVAPQHLAPLSLETLLDVPYAEQQERNEIVNSAALAIAFTLGDSHSKNFYHRLIWNLLRQFDRGNNWFEAVYTQVLRTRADVKEGYAKSGGALLHSRLKGAGFWDELKRTPPYRVGGRPLAA